EGKLDGVQLRISPEEIPSETSKKIFMNINKVQKEIFQGLSPRDRNFYLGEANGREKSDSIIINGILSLTNTQTPKIKDMISKMKEMQ
ncbi:MAG: hypothetical protein EZS28_028330, partial [Streblomastix strix]